MKSRTSLFNPTAFRKDVTRFAPTWVLYTVGLFMILTVVMMDSSEYYRASGLGEILGFMAFVNLCYGFLNGQLLFGDLFNARHCNALHAMPLRRECWYVTHVVSGLLFALVPNALFALVCLPMLGSGWQVAVWWYLATAMQYLFFFGLAALSALCVGNRFAMLLVYGIVNGLSLIIYWFYHTIYEPLLYGVCLTEDPFLLWCPAWKMMDNYEMIVVTRNQFYDGYQYTYDYLVKSVSLGEGWGYLGICAGLGVLFFGIALLLYHRRKLECAGDFMAVRPLEPVFLVLYTMAMAAFFQIFGDLFGVNEWVFLSLGLVVGFFTGRMLLMRTTRVFQLKGFIWFGILAAAFGLTLLLTWLDPVGVTRYIPDTGDVARVKLSYYYNPYYSEEPFLTEEADIDTIRQLHGMILEGQTYPADHESPEEYYTNLCLLYELENGVTVVRKYQAAASSHASQLAATVFTRPEYVLGTDNAEKFMAGLERVYFDQNKAIGEGGNGELYMNHTNRAYLRGLVEAILADCAEGTMAQNHSYHSNEEQYAWMEFSRNITEDGGDWYDYRNVTIYPSNRHTVAYLEENPFPVKAEEEMAYTMPSVAENG